MLLLFLFSLCRELFFILPVKVINLILFLIQYFAALIRFLDSPETEINITKSPLSENSLIDWLTKFSNP